MILELRLENGRQFPPLRIAGIFHPCPSFTLNSMKQSRMPIGEVEAIATLIGQLERRRISNFDHARKIRVGGFDSALCDL
jgi:hypothetical protein